MLRLALSAVNGIEDGLASTTCSSAIATIGANLRTFAVYQFTTKVPSTLQAKQPIH